MATRAATWQRNALFRVLAFLDNTGTQSFELAEEVAEDGTFLQPARVFAEGQPVRCVLEAGLVALRSNVMRLFSDPDERQALLRIIGVDGTATVTAAETSSTTTTGPTTTSGPVPCAAGADTSTSAPTQSTPWSVAVRCPASLRAFADILEDGFPINLFCRLQEVLAVPLDLATTATESPLTEQFLIDALDRYVTDLPAAELDRMILACGVQPPVLAAVRAGEGADDAGTARGTVDTLSDFVIDVVFPTAATMSATSSESTQESEGGGPVLDWLLLSYEKNHESISVDDGEADSGVDVNDDSEDSEGGCRASPPKRPRRESVVATPPVPEDTGLKGWTPDHGELVLTADNLDDFMQRHPHLIPREIVRERRRAWTNPAITRFELANHYTAGELRAAVRQLALLPSTNDESRAELERQLGHSVDDEVIRAAGKAVGKERYIDVILRCHGL